MPIISRRAFLRTALVSLTGGVGTSIYANQFEPSWLEVVRLEVPLQRLPDGFADFTIAHISDLHFGKYIQTAHMDPVVRTVQDLCADAIVITGDIVSRVTQGEPDMIVQTLGSLQAAHGVYAVLGNHDWWENGPLVIETLRRIGITVLCNEHLSLHRNGETLYLVGLDDVWCSRHNLSQAVHGIPSDAAILALVHEPDYADVVAHDSRVLLQMSGHSHGGQVRVPFYGGLHFPAWGSKYVMGMYQIGGLTLYTNRGVGVVGLPIRFACRPEVTLYTLKPAN